ncbi:MAG: hypothetical protein RR416_01500 [Clostridia bacterium]
MSLRKRNISLEETFIRNNAQPTREAYFVLANRLDSIFVDTKYKILAVATACAGEGATSTALNLTAAFNLNGATALYIDLNPDNHNIATSFDTNARPVQENSAILPQTDTTKCNNSTAKNSDTTAKCDCSTAKNSDTAAIQSANDELNCGADKDKCDCATTKCNNATMIQGVSDALNCGKDINNYIVHSDYFSFDILPFGSATVNLTLQSKLQPDWLAQISDKYEWLIIDFPPLATSADILGLAAVVKNALVVTRENYSQNKTLLHLNEQLVSCGYKVVGCNYIK